MYTITANELENLPVHDRRALALTLAILLDDSSSDLRRAAPDNHSDSVFEMIGQFFDSLRQDLSRRT